MSDPILIYGASMSPFVRKTIAVCIEKDVAFRLKVVGRGDKDPEFREASPFGKMPAIRDGDFTLADSSAIAHYLEARHPEPALLPSEPEALGKTIWWDEFADTILFACGADLFFNRVVGPLFEKGAGDPAIADAAEAQELPPILDHLEGAVPDEDGFLVGDSLTLADLAVASPFANLDHAGASIDWAKYPRLDAWTKKMLGRPSLAGSVQREQAFFRKIGHRVGGRI